MITLRSLLGRVGLTTLLLTACGKASDAVPTAGVTVQAFPHVEIVTSTSTQVLTVMPLPTEAPPTSTNTPTEVPTLAPTETPLSTATPLIQLAPPTATLRFVQPTQPRATQLSPPTSTSPAPVAPIRFRAVQFVSAQPDSSRPPDGAITRLSVEFTGSRPPFSLKHDNLVGSFNPNGDGSFDDSAIIYTFIYFTVAKTCGGPIVGTITITGGDGQSFTHDYYVPSAPCS